MAKKTLLKIVQNILNDLDSDEVNSIDDTVESQQVANIVEACYNEMISNRNWPHLKRLIQLEESGDLSKPTYLKLPEGLKELITFHYNRQRPGQLMSVLQEVHYKNPEDFLRFISGRNSTVDWVTPTIDTSGSTLLIVNNQPPTYWTSFDDTYIVCDAYDADIDDTLRKAKTQCLAYVETPWEAVDDFIPNLPEEAFAALEEEAKSTAFIVLKQSSNPKAEQKAARQNRWLSRKAWRAHGGIQYCDFGRKGRK